MGCVDHFAPVIPRLKMIMQFAQNHLMSLAAITRESNKT
jgi:hypothetical protein